MFIVRKKEIMHSQFSKQHLTTFDRRMFQSIFVSWYLLDFTMSKDPFQTKTIRLPFVYLMLPILSPVKTFFYNGK